MRMLVFVTIIYNFLFSSIAVLGGLAFIGVFIFSLVTGSMSEMGNGNVQLTFLFLLIMSLLSLSMILSIFSRTFICVASSLTDYVKHLRWDVPLGSGTIAFLESPIEVMKKVYIDRKNASEKDVIYYTALYIFRTATICLYASIVLFLPMVLVTVF
ncbi:hypothetical protein A1OU_06995 [Enterovibrio norvegicus]|nr:hypothetical protein A1OU_06995 [Enterovibrio norvegicus]